jgi:hypothetical protein
MYTAGTCARIANFLANDPQMAQQLTITCWDSVLFILKVASINKFLPNRSSLAANEATGVLFDAATINNAINRKRTDVIPDSVVGIFKRSPVGNHSFELSHVAIAVEAAGYCVGSNNGCIGESPSFSRFNIMNSFQWVANQYPIYNDPLNPNAPPWAKERMVVFRPISQILR